MDPQQQQAPSMEEIMGFMTKLTGFVTGSMLMSNVLLGDRLGLFEGLAKYGPCTAEELAAHLGFRTRWVEEWARGQASGGCICYDLESKNFYLDSVQRLAFTNEKESPLFFVGAAELCQHMMQRETFDRAVDSFQRGQGVNYDAHGVCLNQAVARFFNPWRKTHLVETVSKLPGLREKLQNGAKVADVGCGDGESLRILAKAFPNSDFHGYELSQVCLKLAADKQKKQDEGIRERIRFHDVAQDPLPEDSSFDFVLSCDCIHDMSEPLAVMKAIRKSLKDDGVWFSAEPAAMDSFEENLQKNPAAAMFYSCSLFVCMPSALSGPDGSGAGLGAMGYTPAVAKKMCQESGFGDVVVHAGIEFHSPFNTFYEIRPAGAGGGSA